MKPKSPFFSKLRPPWTWARSYESATKQERGFILPGQLRFSQVECEKSWRHRKHLRVKTVNVNTERLERCDAVTCPSTTCA